MRESFTTKLMRWKFNYLSSPYRGTGGRVDFIAADWSEVRLRIPLNRRTRNYVGTTFGGSMYGAVDPIFMIMLIQSLGDGYVVWDKAATIRFRAPGRTTLYATCAFPPGEVEEVRRILTREPRVDRSYEIEIVDADGNVHAEVEKIIHVRRREAA